MDENSKVIDGGAAKTPADNSATLNPNPNPNPNSDVTITNSDVVGGSDGGGGGGGGTLPQQNQSSRTPFTNLSQVDADLALARTLQEQERAYMMLSMNGGGGVGFGRWETGIYIPDDDDDDFGDSHEYDDEDEDVDEDDEDNEEFIDNYDDDDEDAFDIHAHDDSGDDDDATNVELDPSAYPDDEAYARALQDAEEREMAARLLAMAGISEREIVDLDEDHGGHSQDTWEEVDPDELSYEELIALGDVVGTESRGLSADAIASLPSTNYKSKNNNETETDSCVICRLDYEDGDAMITLPCKHIYHSDCINNWLKINKACPVCSTEVSTSGNSK